MSCVRVRGVRVSHAMGAGSGSAPVASRARRRYGGCRRLSPPARRRRGPAEGRAIVETRGRRPRGRQPGAVALAPEQCGEARGRLRSPIDWPSSGQRPARLIREGAIHALRSRPAAARIRPLPPRRAEGQPRSERRHDAHGESLSAGAFQVGNLLPALGPRRQPDILSVAGDFRFRLRVHDRQPA